MRRAAWLVLAVSSTLAALVFSVLRGASGEPTGALAGWARAPALAIAIIASMGVLVGVASSASSRRSR